METPRVKSPAEILAEARANTQAKQEPLQATAPDNRTPIELADEADRLHTALGVRTGFIRDGKTHPKLTRQQLVDACRKTLTELIAVSRLISPHCRTGYIDPRLDPDPFSEHCLEIWQREIDMLAAGHNATPIDPSDPPADHVMTEAVAARQANKQIELVI
jgi:hypothetical protein